MQAGEMSREVHHTPVYRVRRFVEKPDLRKAQEFLGYETCSTYSYS